MSRPVFGVDRLPDPWPVLNEDGELDPELERELAEEERLGQAYHDAFFGKLTAPEPPRAAICARKVFGYGSD